jgi:predicted dehydrogenase
MKFGLIGAGAIGAIRAAALQRSTDCSLTAVQDLEEARARAAAPGAAVFTTPEALIDSPDVEAVVISTPPQFHEALATAAVRAGKHVLIEKPMAPTAEACERMIAAARDAGRLLTVGFNHRYFAAVKLVRDLVTSGELGRLSHVKAFTGHTGLAEFKAPWMYDPAVMGGGALADNGVHMLDLCRYVMGDFTEVYGHATHRVWELPAEDNAFALFRNAEGALGSLHASWSEWKGYRFHIEAYGERGMARAYYAPMMATVIRLDRPGGARRVERRFYPEAIVREKLKGWQSTVIAAFLEEFSDFAAAARGEAGSGRLARGEDGLRAVQIAQAVYASGREGRAHTLPGL